MKTTPGLIRTVRPGRSFLLAALGVLIASACDGQAIGIARPMTVADSAWINRQCESFDEISVTDQAVAAGVDRAQRACAEYWMSSLDPPARDAWVRAMLEIQDDVGPEAMRGFIPEFGSELPTDLESYSLFLLPDDRWRSSERAQDRAALWEAAYSFGRSIGDRHVAIWFLDQEDNVDVLRSQEYCRLFNLSYNDGPYVVTVPRRPDLLEASDEIIVVRMGGISPDRILTVLNRLSRDLTEAEGIATGPLVYEELKQRFITSVGRYPEGVRAFLSAVIGG